MAQPSQVGGAGGGLPATFDVTRLTLGASSGRCLLPCHTHHHQSSLLNTTDDERAACWTLLGVASWGSVKLTHLLNQTGKLLRNHVERG